MISKLPRYSNDVSGTSRFVSDEEYLRSSREHSLGTEISAESNSQLAERFVFPSIQGSLSETGNCWSIAVCKSNPRGSTSAEALLSGPCREDSSSLGWSVAGKELSAMAF